MLDVLLLTLAASAFHAPHVNLAFRMRGAATVAVVVDDQMTALEPQLAALEAAAIALVGKKLDSESASRIRGVSTLLGSLTADDDTADETESPAASDDLPSDHYLWLQAASGSDAQRRVWLRADAFFEAIDENGDGQISFDELEQHLSGLGFKTGAIDHIFDLLDISRDGLITKEELRQTLVTYEDPAVRMVLGLGASDADDVFDEIDVNGDGEISRAELAAYLELNSSSAADVPACARTIFKALDVNGDGSLSREELRVGFDDYTEFRRVLGLDRR